MNLEQIRQRLLSEGYSRDWFSLDEWQMLNIFALNIMNMEELDVDLVNDLGILLNICNILYNNTDMDPLPIEDGVYDLLLEKYKKYNPNYQVGAEPIQYIETVGNIKQDSVKTVVNPFIRLSEEELEDAIFTQELMKRPPITREDYVQTAFFHPEYITKRLTNTAHNYPELVGTLDKCKFVMNYQAKDRGLFDDPNVAIFERDFMEPVIQAGLLDPKQDFAMIAELKYDGISIEADIEGDEIISARSRGDTANDEATDLTPILKGYKFRHATDSRLKDLKFGMKFEAIITYPNLERLSQIRGKDYKNARNAIIGLFGSSDAYLYRDFITLVPLATSLTNMSRIEELEFMNKYYHSGEYCRYTIIAGNYIEVMYMVKKFVDEAEYMRSILPFMYDGVVISFFNEKIKKALGRKNFVNKYSVAIKFNTMKKNTKFLGYTYTVGQNGVITPMINYAPIEFYGMVQTKSSGHSYKRFQELGLRLGDVITAEYVNDVMTYISKPDIEENDNNPNPIVEFITHCPECGAELEILASGKTVCCPNLDCIGRKTARAVNMLKKINFKDVAEETIKQIGVYTLHQFMSLDMKTLLDKGIGEVTANNILNQIKEIKTTPMPDYRIMASIGMAGMGPEKWKLILTNIPLLSILDLSDDELSLALSRIKGIGYVAVNTILSDRLRFVNDLKYIMNMPNIIYSYGMECTGKHIRFSGVRDKELMMTLQSMGHDATDGSVTKTTDILLVPTVGYTSTKLKALPPTAIVVPIADFRANMDMYLL